jgi:hypothetical protein
MLADALSYKLWQRDHIIPKCAGGGEDFDNLAVACRHCNWDFKRDWNPRTAIAPNLNPGREDLIEAVKVYVQKKRGDAEAELECELLLAAHRIDWLGSAVGVDGHGAAAPGHRMG